jgi:hypothetical protein
MKNAVLIFSIVLSGAFASAQSLGVGEVNAYPRSMVNVTVDNGDTLAHITEYTAVIVAERTFSSARQKMAWDKLKRDVKKAYPYAVLAKMKLSEMDAQLALIHGENARKAFTEKCEDELVDQFEADMRNLTASQGRILLKLMDRETNSTTYEIIKEHRGSFQAFMWQGVAILFGNNLKSEYDATGEDAAIEAVVQLIELGVI